MVIFGISIIIILICQNLGSVQPVQQKIKFPLPSGTLKINQLSISSALQILNKQVGELLSEGEIISCKRF